MRGRVSVDYIDYVIWDLLLNGVFDFDNRKDELRMEDILIKLINNVIAFVEIKEMVRNVFLLVLFFSILTISR